MEKIRDNWILHLAGHAKIPTLPLPPTLTRYKIEESVLRKIKEKNPNFKFEHIPLSVVDGAQTPPSPTEPTVKKEPESPANKKRKAK
jgi:hypothetical protein